LLFDAYIVAFAVQWLRSSHLPLQREADAGQDTVFSTLAAPAL
jgi:hypothetical protein